MLAMIEKGVDKRLRPISCSWMDDHARRFIHDEYIIIFVADIERNRFWCDINFLGQREEDLNFVAHLRFDTFLYWLAVKKHLILGDQILKIGAGAHRIVAIS